MKKKSGILRTRKRSLICCSRRTVNANSVLSPLKGRFFNSSHRLRVLVRYKMTSVAKPRVAPSRGGGGGGGGEGDRGGKRQGRETVIARKLAPNEVVAAVRVRMVPSIGACNLRPKSVYMDGMTPVELPEEHDDPITGCPPSWTALFKLHRRQGKFPYMHDKLMREKSEVGEAFRNLMHFVFDKNGIP